MPKARGSPEADTAAAVTTVVRLAGLGTALPPLRMSQAEILDFVLAHLPSLKPSTQALYRRVLRHPSIETRHFAFDHPRETLDTNHERTLARFERRAVDLATRALERALERAGTSPRELEFLVCATCTGYLCPGLSSRVAEGLRLEPGARLADLVGMGCGAAVPAIAAAADFLAARPGARAAAVCVEVCSAAMFSDDSADLVVSNGIFADGAAAAVLDGSAAAGPRWTDTASFLAPEWREELRFRTEGGRLRNVLGKDVPTRAAEALSRLIPSLLARHRLDRADIAHWALHPGGHKVLDALQSALDLDDAKLAPSRAALRRYGNMSSPSCLFVLDDILSSGRARPGDRTLLAAFGAGFSAHAALLTL